MQVSDLFRFKNREIKALHLTWIAFFICFYVWFNMAPLASSMLKTVGWLTKDDIRLFAIANVALTIPARIIVGMALDRFGPRRVFSILMVLMAIPTLVFAFGSSKEQLFVSRLVLSSVGASFVVGIHMTALWFKPRDIGFAEGFYAGWGNFGSAAAAMTLPTIALTMFGGPEGWRYAVALSGLVMGVYGVFYWFAITDGPTADTHKKPRKAAALEVSSYRDLILLAVMTVPMVGILGGWFVGVVLIGIDDGSFWSQMQGGVEVWADVGNGFIKSVVFGITVTFVALLQGYECQPTPEGVSRATTRTVVMASLAVLGLDFILTAMMFSSVWEAT